jgi:hypothetical protein
VQTVTPDIPTLLGWAPARPQASGLASGLVNTSFQVGLALRFAAAVAGVAAHLALAAIRRPSTAASDCQKASDLQDNTREDVSVDPG